MKIAVLSESPADVAAIPILIDGLLRRPTQPIDAGNHLKRYVYGTERLSLTLETQRAVEAAQRLVLRLSVLESLFPNGFGSLNQSA